MDYFLTLNWIQKKMPITANVSPVNLQSFIQTTAELNIQPILGSYFYDDLLAKYVAKTLSADEEVLVEKMRFAMAWRVLASALSSVNYPLTNNGLQSKNSDNSDSVDLDVVRSMEDKYSDFARQYENNICDYLYFYHDKYPVFMSNDNKDSLVRPRFKDESLGIGGLTFL